MLFSLKFFTLSAFLAAITIVNAESTASTLVSRDIFDPIIIVPNATTVWTASELVNVTWDTSNAPSSISNYALITLESVSLNYGPTILAEGFSLLAGYETITIPADCETSDDYKITLFGDSGDFSPEFTISSA